MTVFEPSIVSPADHHGASWLYFRGSEILVDEEDVLHPSPEALGLSVHDAIYLGTIDGRDCFVAELDSAARGRFVSLRAALLSASDGLVNLMSAAAELIYFEQSHRRCSRCGGNLVSAAAERVDRAKRCEACAVDFYPRIAPAAIVLVHDGPRFLLTHVGDRPFWALVAGFLEPGETLEQCAAREVREETGVAIDEVRYFGSQPWPFPSQVMVGFHARYAGGDIVVDRRELDEAKWFGLDDLPPLPPRLSIARRLIDARVAQLRETTG